MIQLFSSFIDFLKRHLVACMPLTKNYVDMYRVVVVVVIFVVIFQSYERSLFDTFSDERTFRMIELKMKRKAWKDEAINV